MKAKILFFLFQAEITHIQDSGNFKFDSLGVFISIYHCIFTIAYLDYIIKVLLW